MVPEQPSLPFVRSRAGAVDFLYDGLDFRGEARSVGQTHIEVHVDEYEGFEIDTFTTLKGTIMGGAGVLSVSSLEYDDEQWVRYVAVSADGRSVPSDPYAFSVTRVKGTDIDPTTPPPAEWLSDGAAPATVPPPAARPFGIGAIEITWPKIVNGDPHEPVTYVVYGHTAPAVPADAAHVVGSVYEGGSIVVDRTADGARLSFDAPTYFVLQTMDTDGPGPLSAVVSATPRRAANTEISSDYAYLGQVEAAQINAGRMFTDLAESDVFSTGPDDPRVVMDASGFVATEATGQPRFSLPTDPALPAEFRGVAELDSAIIKDRLAIRGKENEIARNARIRLGQSIGKPTAPPTVAVWWPSNTVNYDPAWAEGGMKKFSDGKWYSYLNAFGEFQIKVREEATNGSLGAATVLVHEIPTDRQYTVHDFVEMNGRLHVLAGDSTAQETWWTTKMRVIQYDMATGARLRSDLLDVPNAVRKRAMAVENSSLNRVAVFSVVQSTAEDVRQWQQTQYVLPTAGASSPGIAPVSGTGWITTVNYPDEDITSAQVVPNAGLVGSGSGTQWAVTRSGSALVYVLLGSSGARNPTYEFDSKSGTGNKTVWWDGTSWHSWNQGRIYHLSSHTWVGDHTTTQTWAVKYSWFDRNGVQHESPSSDAATFAMKKFGQVKVSTPALPAPDEVTPDNSPTGIRVYWKAPATNPDFRRGTVDLPDGVTSVTYKTVVQTGSVPDTGNPIPFPNAVPGEIYTEAGGFTLKGDGTGDWPLVLGPLRDALAALQAATADTGWISVGAAGAPAFLNGWENYEASPASFHPAQYRRIGKVVYLRGLVKSVTGGDITQPIFLLPYGFRPVRSSMFPAVINVRTQTSGGASTGTAHTHSIAQTAMGVRLDVYGNGNIVLPVVAGVTFGTGYLSLEGISFITDQV